jgi:hypothetical protein
MRKIILSFILIFTFIFSYSQQVTVSGKIIDENGKPVDFVDISSTDDSYYTQSDEHGIFSIKIPVTVSTLVFQHQNFNELFWQFKHTGKDLYFDIILKSKDNVLNEVEISGSKLNSSSNMRIDPKIIRAIPSVSGGIESLLMTQLGVSSHNELSSQYNVRGGNFDENLVYVNGTEVYRPQLIRSGQQEGLSFVNPQMVSAVHFSAGGFEAQYGDKMASVLDVRYRKPTKFGMSASAGLLGADIFGEGTAFSKKLKFISGLRYKTSQYILNSLETSGSYRPSFIDYQAYLTYSVNSKLDFNFLFNISDNKFNFVPESSHTSFGTISESYGLDIVFEGREADLFSAETGAFTADFHSSKNLQLMLTLSGFTSKESETYDISGYYSINQLNNDIGSGSAGDSILNLGIGKFMNHARNFLNINQLSLSHTGIFTTDVHTLRWGAEVRQYQINDKLDEWQLLDSAGYSIPYNAQYLNVYENIKAKNQLTEENIISYIQDTYNFETETGKFEIIGGVRENLDTYNHQFLLSPRISGAYMPETKHKHIFRLSGGVYDQPPFYKEIRMPNGALLADSKAQRSIHFVAGNEFAFQSFGRTFKMYTEIYYKILKDIIPYQIDNVQIKYYANQRANGYAAGIDMKIGGEFVPDVDSWFSLSLMKTEENVYNDGTGKDDGYGRYPRPTDQRATVGIFFQDYLPGHKNLRANLNLLYGTPLPYGPPNTQPHDAILRMPDYKRVDLGFTAVIIDSEAGKPSARFKFLKSLWLTIEVFNLLDVDNTISYNWVRVVPNTSIAFNGTFEQYAVPNHLTGRRLNLKLSISF